MITDYRTPEGMVRVTDAHQGALRKAYLYPGVYDSDALQVSLNEWHARIRNIGKAQALLAKSEAAKEAMHAARAKSKTVPFVPDMKLADVIVYYKGDRAVMKAAKEYETVLKQVYEQVPVIDMTPPYSMCFADDHGPVERIGATYAVGNDGAAYQLINGAWMPTKGQ